MIAYGRETAAARRAPSGWIGERTGTVPGWTFLATLALVTLCGCGAQGYLQRADRATTRLLESRRDATVGQREELTQRPQPRALETAPSASEPASPQAVAAETEWIELDQALRIAVTSNRTYLAQREGLYLTALNLTATRHGFTPQLGATLGYLFRDADGLEPNQDAGLAFGASQILPWGGAATLDASSGGNASAGDSASYDTAISIRLTQPLLRGFGREVAWEPLFQAERELVYAIRDFELFREDFTIQVATRFYDLVQQKQGIENLERNVENFVFGREQAEAFFRVGRVNELDVLRARRSELNAKNDLLSTQESYQLALDRFKIFLGIATTRVIDVAGDPPPFTAADYDVDSAVAVAFENRLDLLTQRQQLEDIERGVRITRNGLLPDLDVSLTSSFGASPSGSLGGDSLNETDHSLALNLEIPLDRVRERNAYRASQIGLDRARRALDEFEDNLVVEIRSAFRELERRLLSLSIQEQLIQDQSKNLRIANLRYERGEIANRDVVEAGQSLLEAENALINEQVSYEIARLQLLRNLGILFIDDEGMWK